jgi:hypothetical protein
MIPDIKTYKRKRGMITSPLRSVLITCSIAPGSSKYQQVSFLKRSLFAIIAYAFIVFNEKTPG